VVYLELLARGIAWRSHLRKCLIDGRIVPQWLRCPINISKSLCFTRGADARVDICDNHDWCLSKGSEIDKVRVFISHPKIVFDSSIWPSASNFFNDIMSFLGMGSSEFSSLARV